MPSRPVPKPSTPADIRQPLLTPKARKLVATAIQSYHATLQRFSARKVHHEGAVETAFGRLLTDTAPLHRWTLIPKQRMTVEGQPIVPDGTLQDDYHLPRGYWEAKDSDDNLDVEIGKKIAKRYPLSNTIFEDTRQAVLYQSGREVARYDLTKPPTVRDLLDAFYAYTEPDVIGFERAIAEFKLRVPELGEGLAQLIAQAHRQNATFETAFADFFALCREALNPNIRTEAVDEMLVQHLLTERLFRKVFRDSDFIRRNVIAQKVDAIVQALVRKSFNRDEYLKPLDRFYRAIELAADTIQDFQGKQHFLNTVYERFFRGYAVKLADTHGIVYTPQPIVDFMCQSVGDVLRDEFGAALGTPGVKVLDPCTGTGNYLVNLIRRVPKRDLPRAYRDDLFANEVMLLPYYVASVNIEHAYYEQVGQYEPFEGLCFVDTLDLANPEQRQFDLFNEENAARVDRERAAAITVIIGNPPYNAWQLNENDNNKNRKYPVVDRRVQQTYTKDSTASNKNALSDPYVKFFRWATDRLGTRDGIVCFVSNNSFVEQIAFDGMRKHLLRDFTRVYHLHLEGNVRQNPRLAGSTYNVFGIQVGVGITVAVRSSRHTDRRLYFQRIDKLLKRQDKLAWLAEQKSVSGVRWQLLSPDDRHTWLVPERHAEYAAFTPLGSRAVKAAEGRDGPAVFKSFSLGVKSNRDDVVYDSDRPTLAARVRQFAEDYNAEVDRYKRAKGVRSIDTFVRYDRVKWSESLKANVVRGRYAEFRESDLRTALFRPFCKRWHCFNELLVERRYQFPQFFPTAAAERENRVIVVSDIGYRASGPSALMADRIVDLHACASLDAHQCFPFYVYDEDGSNRRENVTDWALKQFRTRYRSPRISKWDIFHYVYGVLHHPGYRTEFADSLKRELPRIPFAPDFRAFVTAGRDLADLHLQYEQLGPYPLEYRETPGMPLSYRVDGKMKLDKAKTTLRVNSSLTLAGIPPETFEYRLGNRSALEWVIDQFQVSEGSTLDRQEDPEYVVNLVGQVVKASVETVKIVKSLPTVH